MSPDDDRLLAHRRGLYPAPTTEGRGRNMQAIKRSGTKPETLLRSALHREGLRFRKDYRMDFRSGRVRPDVVFTRTRVAVFVDGCFWHGCPLHGRLPSVNDWYWGPKLARTIERDQRANEILQSEGYTVVRVWEHVPIEETTPIIRSLATAGDPDTNAQLIVLI